MQKAQSMIAPFLLSSFNDITSIQFALRIVAASFLLKKDTANSLSKRPNHHHHHHHHHHGETMRIISAQAIAPYVPSA